MSKETNISWCDHTASPWYGCAKISPGCANCYAEGWSRRGGYNGITKPLIWEKGNKRQKSMSFERDCRKWNREAGEMADRKKFLSAAYGQPTARPTVFPSLCDWLDSEVDPAWLASALRVMHECGNLNFLLLTKRPENFDQRMSAAERLLGRDTGIEAAVRQWAYDGQPPDNIWIGTSCENQEYADKRIPELLRIPARVRFLSLEPLLGPVDLRLRTEPDSGWNPNDPDWVIVGGESGPGHRPMQIEWLESIAEQCNAAGVPLFVKQDSGRFPGQQGRIPNRLWAHKEFPKTY